MSRQPTSYFHRGGDQALLGATIAEHFSDVVARFGEREAVVSLPQQRRLSYRALADAVDRLAKGLAGSGFVK
ncbi:MAG: AMP-binding protein, partial [Gammaproteobacteria bacterium]